MKAAIHRGVSRLPGQLSYSANFFLQRHFGRLTGADPSLEHLRAGLKYAEAIVRQGRPLAGCTVLEIGTGWHLDLSIALWLCGAERVLTVDVNPFLQAEIALEHLAYVRAHRENVLALFSPFVGTALFQDRFRALLELPQNLPSLLQLTGITYCAPENTSHLNLPDAHVDYFISYNVMQYITPSQLEYVLREGTRLLKKGGLHLHAIDMTDWFAHSDRSISKINFLRFSELEWRKLAGNRYMYQNRMRIDDYRDLLARLGFTVHCLEVTTDQKTLELLSAGFPLDQEFSGKSIETNAASNAWIVASPA